MLEHILVPLDGSPAAEAVLPYAAYLAKQLGVEMTLLHIIEPDELRTRSEEHQAYLDQLQQNAEAAARSYLESQAQQLTEQGVSVAISVHYGKPADVLLAHGETAPAGNHVIALTTHGRSGGLALALLGSVTDRLLHGARSPLLVVHPREGVTGGPLTRITVPLDGSPLAEGALPLASELAKRLRLPMSLVWVVPVAAVVYGGPGPYPSNLLADIQDAAKTYLQEVCERLRREGIEADFEVLIHHGAAAGIIEHTGGRSDQLVAMSTHGRSGLDRWLLGSVTNRVVRSGVSPVLVVRPEAGGSS